MKKITLLAIFSLMATVMSAQNSLTNTSGDPITAEQGETFTVTFDYIFETDANMPAAYAAQFQVFSSESGFIFDGGQQDVPGTYNLITLTQSSTVQNGSVQITLPDNVTPSADLPAGTKYWIFGKLEDVVGDAGDTTWQDVNDNHVELTIVPSTLSTNEFSKENGVSYFVRDNQLTINGAISGKEMRIFDVSGRTMLVAPIKGDINTFNISGLSSGVYVAVTEAGSFKFAK